MPRIWPDDYDKCVELSQGGIIREHNHVLDDNVDLRHENEFLRKQVRLLRKEVMFLKGHLEIIRSYADPPTIDQILNMTLPEDTNSNPNQDTTRKRK